MPKTYDPIATYTAPSAQTTVTFSSIPQTYTDLHLVVFCPGFAGSGEWLMRLNSDGASNYSRTYLFGTGTTAGSGRDGGTQFGIGAARTDGWLKFDLQNYANTTTYKTALWTIGSAGNDIATIVGLWRKTPEAVNRIDFTGGATYPTGSTFTLYGIKAA